MPLALAEVGVKGEFFSIHREKKFIENFMTNFFLNFYQF